MEEIISKEEVVAMLIERYAVNTDERLFIEAVCAVIYEQGMKEGLLFASKTLMSPETVIIESGLKQLIGTMRK